MKCPHCGEELPEGFVYNKPEQENIEETTDNTNVSDETEYDNTAQDSYVCDKDVIHTPDVFLSANVIEDFKREGKKKIFKRVAVSALVTAVVISAVSAGVTIYGKSKLQDRLTGTWQTDGDIFSSSVIEFNKNTVSYSETMGFMEINSVTLPYTVKNSDTVIINDMKFKITFEGENTMVMSPGLTGGSAQTWYSSDTGNEQENNNNQNNSDNSGIL